MFQFFTKLCFTDEHYFSFDYYRSIAFCHVRLLISGALHVFLTPERVKKVLPKNKFLSICVGSFLGVFLSFL